MIFGIWRILYLIFWQLVLHWRFQGRHALFPCSIPKHLPEHLLKIPVTSVLCCLLATKNILNLRMLWWITINGYSDIITTKIYHPPVSCLLSLVNEPKTRNPSKKHNIIFKGSKEWNYGPGWRSKKV